MSSDLNCSTSYGEEVQATRIPRAYLGAAGHAPNGGMAALFYHILLCYTHGTLVFKTCIE